MILHDFLEERFKHIKWPAGRMLLDFVPFALIVIVPENNKHINF